MNRNWSYTRRFDMSSTWSRPLNNRINWEQAVIRCDWTDYNNIVNFYLTRSLLTIQTNFPLDKVPLALMYKMSSFIQHVQQFR